MTYARKGMGHAETRGGSCSGSSLGIRVSSGENMCVSDDQVSEAVAAGCAILSERCTAESFRGNGRLACCPPQAVASLASTWSIESGADEMIAEAPAPAGGPFAPMPEEWSEPFQTASAWLGNKAEQVATTVASWTGGEAMPAAGKAGAEGAMPGMFQWPGVFGPSAPAVSPTPGVQPAAPGAPAAAAPTISMASMIPGGTATLVVGGIAALLVGGLIVTAIVRRGEED